MQNPVFDLVIAVRYSVRKDLTNMSRSEVTKLLEALHDGDAEALQRLATLNERQVRVVECRYFIGLNIARGYPGTV